MALKVNKITVGGIGSVLLGDDGVGPLVAGMLDANYLFSDNVTIADLGTPGLDLVAHLSGIDAAILIDSVKNEAEPGTVTLYRREEILRHGPAPVRVDPHSPALSESLLIADLTGQGPKEILLIGITGQQYEIGAEPSEVVRRAADIAVRQVLAELERLGATYSEREGQEFSPWWTSTGENPVPVLL